MKQWGWYEMLCVVAEEEDVVSSSVSPVTRPIMFKLAASFLFLLFWFLLLMLEVAEVIARPSSSRDSLAASSSSL